MDDLLCRYKLALLKPCQKAVNQSTKISIRMDQRGFLSLQCMILTTDKQICFVEYLVSQTTFNVHIDEGLIIIKS